MSLVIHPAQPIPIFVQLPTEHDLCAMYQISRTPVNRALTELASVGVVVRHRRRGTFVNPHWVKRNANGPEVRVVVPDGPWTELLEAAVPQGVSLNIVRVELTAAAG